MRTARTVLCVSAGALCVALSACEEHKSAAISAAPELQHAALSGKTSAQAWLAGCYAAAGRCVGVAPDPALACAWSSVRLLSGAADLALADNEANTALCDLPHGSDRQRAAIVASDLAERVYGRGDEAATLPSRTAGEGEVLYPAPETIRTRINAALAQVNGPERLPAFSSAESVRPGYAVRWSSCAEPVCLRVEAPSTGGGVRGYTVAVRVAGAGEADAARLAGRLAAAGLDAPALAATLGEGHDREFVRGPVCWRAGKGDAATMQAGASRAPCRAP